MAPSMRAVALKSELALDISDECIQLVLLMTEMDRNKMGLDTISMNFLEHIVDNFKHKINTIKSLLSYFVITSIFTLISCHFI